MEDFALYLVMGAAVAGLGGYMAMTGLLRLLRKQDGWELLPIGLATLAAVFALPHIF